MIGLLFGASLAQASDVFTPITAPGQFTPNDTATWGNLNGASVFDSENIVAGSNTSLTNLLKIVTITFTLAPPPYGQVVCDGSGCGWTSGTIPVSTWLLTTHAANGAPPPFDQLTLTFTTPISAFGTYIQDQSYTTQFNATLTTNNGGSANFTSDANGDPMYIGIQDTTAGGTFSSVTIDVPSGATGVEIHYFAIGQADLVNGPGPSGPSGVPEPGSIMLVASGIAGLVWKARKHIRA